ncbi:MAG: LamG-like jellyroll fold domain-containing protein, partial [Bacteroidota bacterium]
LLLALAALPGMAQTAPTDITLTPASVTEGLPVGTIVGSLATTDAEGGAMTYALVAGSGDTDNAAFTISGYELRTTTVFKSKIRSTYSIRIRSTDANGLFLEKSFVINVLPAGIPSDGLIGWWPFNGNANDESGNGNDGTINGATLAPDRFGKANSSISFDGIDDFIRCQKAGPTGNPTVSASFWLKAEPAEYGHVIGYGSDGGYGQAFRIYIGDGGGPLTPTQIGFDTYENANRFCTSFQNIWDHYIVTYDGSIGNYTSAASIYKNGILMDQVCFSLNVTPTNISALLPITFGKYHGTIQNGYLKGQLDDIALWNRVLTEQEIIAVSQSGGPFAPSNISLSFSRINDGAQAGSVVGTFTTLAYSGSPFVYSLVPGIGSEDNGSFSLDGPSLKTINGFNASVKSSYSIRIRSTDANGLFLEKSFVINVLPAGIPSDGLIGWWPFNGNAN